MLRIETSAKGRKLLKEKLPDLVLDGMVAIANTATRYVLAVSLLRQARIEFKGQEIK